MEQQKERLVRILRQKIEEKHGWLSIEDTVNVIINDGWIRPLVTIGQEVYCISDGFIDEGIVYAVSQNEEALCFSVKYHSGCKHDHSSDDCGINVFEEKTQAIQALEEREPNDTN